MSLESLRAANNIERDATWAELSFQDRIDTAEFRIHERAHITVNGDSCRGCTTRECVVACPANLLFQPVMVAFCSTTKTVLNVEPVIWSATKPALSPGPTPKAATASSSIAPE